MLYISKKYERLVYKFSTLLDLTYFYLKLIIYLNFQNFNLYNPLSTNYFKNFVQNQFFTKYLIKNIEIIKPLNAKIKIHTEQ